MARRYPLPRRHPIRRLVFVASLGNPCPYRFTRHSAGHLLLDKVKPLLSTELPRYEPLFDTWHSPIVMNQSGPKLVKKFQKWLEVRDKKLGLVGCRKGMTPETWPGLPATLVILHDELEERLGSVRVKRGGPEEASLQGHRGLLSVFESLRGRGVYPFDETKCRIKEGVPPRDLSVLRVGFGIGRPESREKDDVADYVLTDMSPRELEAVERAAKFVFHTLNREFFWNIPEADRPASSGASKVVDSAATSDAPKVVDSAATSGASNVVDSAASSHAPKVVDGATSSGASNV